MSYRVELPVFSGPLDLLLHLIKQQEVDIHEVSIAKILTGYLQHLAVLQHLDLVDIGEFVVMASTLMEIKSRELLPREEVSVEEELDPRNDLIRRLLEYKRYRDLSRRFDRLAHRRSRMLTAGIPLPLALREPTDDEPMLELGKVAIWDLTAAFAKLLEETGAARAPLQLNIERRNAHYYLGFVVKRLLQSNDVPFFELFDRSEGRYGLIGVLIAVLELIKQGFVCAYQETCSDAIVVAYRGPRGLAVDEVVRRIAASDAEVEGDDATPPAAISEAGG